MDSLLWTELTLVVGLGARPKAALAKGLFGFGKAPVLTKGFTKGAGPNGFCMLFEFDDDGVDFNIHVVVSQQQQLRWCWRTLNRKLIILRYHSY